MSGAFLASSSLVVAALALLVERLIGYPHRIARRVSHPVVWAGRLIAALDRRLNRPGLPDLRLRGVLALLVLLAAASAVTVPLHLVLRAVPGGIAILALLATTLIAQKELGERVAAVADGLERSLKEGRAAVAHIVGRDPEALDEAGVARAAIESLAENASDGVVAPLFWLVVAGLPGAAAYKAVNTADSMIGYRDETYRDFGWAAARLDDLANWIPARLTGLLFVLAAASGAGNARAAFAIMRRDAPAHASPNAGWPEAAMAGALGFRLGGRRSYGGKVEDHAEMGDGRDGLGPADIRAALALYARALDILAALTVAAALAVILL